MNLQVRSWFDQDRIAEAILGGEPYFIGGHTWIGDHDRLLVLRELIAWADEERERERAAAGFGSALVTALADDDAWSVYDILWCYFIVSKSNPSALPLDFQEIGRWLDQLETRTLPDGDEIAGTRSLVRDRIPTTQDTAWDRYKLPGRFKFLARNSSYGDKYRIQITAPDHVMYREADIEAYVPAELDKPTVRLRRAIRFTKPFERAATDAEADVILERVQRLLHESSCEIVE